MAPSPARTAKQPHKLSYEEFLDWCDEDTLAEWVGRDLRVLKPGLTKTTFRQGMTPEAILSYFRGIAGSRLRTRLAGSTVMPTDSSAVTPSNGSALSGPKITRPAVISPMNSICTNPKEY